jgi:hypothetical protein
MSRLAWLGLVVVLLALCLGQAPVATAQVNSSTPPVLPTEIQLKTPIKYGDSCRRLNDGGDGIFKRDACGRTYCGLAKVKDIIELQPNFATDHACAWQLDGAQCKCLKARRP